MPSYEYENAAKAKGYTLVCGVDEAGRGPLAGPVCAAAVILPENLVIEGLNDSKKLSDKKREALYEIITEKAVSYSIAFGSVEEIEKYNILNATFMAMTRAVEGLNITPDYALIDGNRMPTGLNIHAETVIKGDSLSFSIAAASIIAKVTRDRLMLEYDKKYPVYGFGKHMGYGTKYHTDKILEFGPSEIHRPSFLKKLYEKNK